MARPRAFDPGAALDAVTDTFWDKGFEATSLTDLEQATGLARSSLYQAFGDKRALFDAALDHYRAQQVDPLLADLERPGAGLPELRAYLATLAAALRADPALAARGCLMVNTMTELGSHDQDAHTLALAYHRRITAAFANALRGTGSGVRQRARTERAARTLFAAVIGVMVTAHLDPDAAADLADLLSDNLTEPT